LGDASQYALLTTAMATGLLHTLIPDHWLPFVLIGRAKNWSVRTTLAVSGLAAGTISVRFSYQNVQNAGFNAESLPLFYLGSDGASSSSGGSDSVSIYVGHGAVVDESLRQVYFTVMEKGNIVLCFDTTVTLVKDRTYVYTVAIAPGSHKAYLDGVEVVKHYNAGTSENDDYFLGSVAAPDMLVFGYHLLGLTQRWWYFNGVIDDVLIYDRVLTDAEVSLVASLP